MKRFEPNQIIKSHIGKQLFIVRIGNCTDCAFGKSKRISRCAVGRRDRNIGISSIACAEILPARYVFKELKGGV